MGQNRLSQFICESAQDVTYVSQSNGVNKLVQLDGTDVVELEVTASNVPYSGVSGVPTFVSQSTFGVYTQSNDVEVSALRNSINALHLHSGSITASFVELEESSSRNTFSASRADDRLNTIETTYATTGSNTFTGDQRIRDAGFKLV